MDTGSLCRAANGDGELGAWSLEAGTDRLDLDQRLLELTEGPVSASVAGSISGCNAGAVSRPPQTVTAWPS